MKYAIRGKRSLKKISRGDEFQIVFPKDQWLYGRVVATDATAFSVKNLILVYIYRTVHSGKNPQPSPSPSQLLIPPLLTDKSPWTRGLFRHIGHCELTEKEMLKQHCFYSQTYKEYFDEHSLPTRKSVPIGQFGIHGDISIEEDIIAALS